MCDVYQYIRKNKEKLFYTLKSMDYEKWSFCTRFLCIFCRQYLAFNQLREIKKLIIEKYINNQRVIKMGQTDIKGWTF